MAKIVIADNREGLIFVIKAVNIAAAKKRMKRLAKKHFQGEDVSGDFDFEIVELI